MKANRCNKEQGSAMLAALLLVAVFGTLSTALLTGDRQVSESSIDDASGLQAAQAAAGGIEQARWRLQFDPRFAGEDVRIGSATVAIAVTRPSASASAWRVVATATCMPRGANALPRRCQVVADLTAGYGGLPRVARWR